MGLFGAVFATGLSPIISMIFMTPHWLETKKYISHDPRAVSRRYGEKDDCFGNAFSDRRRYLRGVQPLLSDFYGRNERTGIRKVLHYAMWTMLIFSLVIYGLLFVFARSVTSVFNSEHNQELQNIAVTGLKIYFLSNVFAGYNTILATYFISVEKAVPAQILSVLRGFLLMIPIVFVSAYLWKMTEYGAAYPLTEMAAAVMGYLMYRRYKKT